LALRIEKAFGVKRYTLMRMAAAYEIAQTRKREKLIRVERVCAGLSGTAGGEPARNSGYR